MLNIVKNRFIYYSISAVIILIGVVMAFVNGGFNLDVEFAGGTEIYVELGEKFDANAMQKAVDAVTAKNAKVQTVDGTNASIKLAEISDAEITAIRDVLVKDFGADEKAISENTISETVGSELKKNALVGALIAVVLMLIYIWIRFELLSGLAAVCALIHDVLIMISAYAILQIPVDTSMIAAILTILGYSINATIVLFDRVRETTRLKPKMAFETVVKDSVKDTMGRSINTTVTTLIVLAVLWILGVDSIRTFTLPIIVGVVAGFYSSVFLSGNFWIMFKKLRKDKNVVAQD
ncbi:MAG: protein translocase subunit SecF [Clostridia bacterium]|nr:protein translocase subunit SecF [Clostridia bacterium]